MDKKTGSSETIRTEPKTKIVFKAFCLSSFTQVSSLLLADPTANRYMAPSAPPCTTTNTVNANLKILLNGLPQT